MTRDLCLISQSIFLSSHLHSHCQAGFSWPYKVRIDSLLWPSFYFRLSHALKSYWKARGGSWVLSSTLENSTWRCVECRLEAWVRERKVSRRFQTWQTRSPRLCWAGLESGRLLGCTWWTIYSFWKDLQMQYQLCSVSSSARLAGIAWWLMVVHPQDPSYCQLFMGVIRILRKIYIVYGHRRVFVQIVLILMPSTHDPLLFCHSHQLSPIAATSWTEAFELWPSFASRHLGSSCRACR